MKILAYNPGHDGAVAFLNDGRLEFSVEAEKDSNWRYTAVAAPEIFDALGRIEEAPDAVCMGGWWPREAQPTGILRYAGYRGIGPEHILQDKRPFLGRQVSFFSSSHERSHLLCGYGMSPFPPGEPCYALVWEGAIGAFYEIHPDMSITLVGEVMSGPGNRYASLYGLADPKMPDDSPYPRFSDAGKLMAIASFSQRREPTAEEEDIMSYLLLSENFPLDAYQNLKNSSFHNVGMESQDFRDFAGIYSDRLFDIFRQFAERNLRPGLPLVITGGCGLNCDWNSKWRATGLFSDIFVPPVANDSGSAIGTAIDAQLHLTGNSKIEWDVYSGQPFESDNLVDSDAYDIRRVATHKIAGLLAAGLILGWVHGKYEIGPRALGNRSILAAPFSSETRVRLNNIKQREQFRPIAPVCLEEDAKRWFGCDRESPYMLYTYQATTGALAAVTHVNGTARLQTVNSTSNPALFELLNAFRKTSAYGVLCNTSLNFNGKGFINRLSDLDTYTASHKLDGFVVDGMAYLRRDSERYCAIVGKDDR